VQDAHDGVNFELVSWNIRYEVFSFRKYLTHRKIGPGEPGVRDVEPEAHGFSFQYLLCNGD
jgi:hypothetical protein